MLTLTWKDWWFCLRWTLATAITLGGSIWLGERAFLVGPILLAIAQGLALVGYWRRAIYWAIATLLGSYLTVMAFLGMLILSFRMGSMPESLVFRESLLAFLICGTLLGLPQAFVLDRVSRFWRWWPLASGITWLISVGWFFTFASNSSLFHHFGGLWQTIIQIAVCGLIGGMLKGLALVWFLKQTPRPSAGR
ncbi:MAG: hypothetical protein F6J95_001930 [Leptolyngbya sp. SIO1E4]|nr:hypothetical protein [Leptolyngbya sp. SIO1E4]